MRPFASRPLQRPKAEWQGVIDNSDEPDLVADARNRLTILLNEEQQQNSPTPGQDGDGN